jgi:phenylalanyl-tRNA synthetase beta chain
MTPVPGTVLATRPHPGADRIWIADVDVDGTTRQIIYGGVPVVTPGCTVLVALPGTTVNGKKIRRRTYRGQSSDGMLCSAAEAGIGTQTDRVHIIQAPGVN